MLAQYSLRRKPLSWGKVHKTEIYPLKLLKKIKQTLKKYFERFGRKWRSDIMKQLEHYYWFVLNILVTYFLPVFHNSKISKKSTPTFVVFRTIFRPSVRKNKSSIKFCMLKILWMRAKIQQSVLDQSYTENCNYFTFKNLVRKTVGRYWRWCGKWLARESRFKCWWCGDWWCT